MNIYQYENSCEWHVNKQRKRTTTASLWKSYWKAFEKKKEAHVKNQWSKGDKTANNMCKTSVQHARKQCTTCEKPVTMWMCVSKVVCQVNWFLLTLLVVKKKECPFLNPTPSCNVTLNGTCFTGDVTCPPGLMCCLDNTCEAKCTLPALDDGKNLLAPLFLRGLWGWNCPAIVSLFG